MKDYSMPKTYRLKYIDVRMEVRRTLSGENSIRLQCASKHCPLGCVMSFKIPVELWSVSEEKLADVLSLPCQRLVKVVHETGVQDGRTRVISSAEKVGS